MAKKKENLISTGKRKRAIARVIVKPGEGKIVVNGKDPVDYFGNVPRIQARLVEALELTGNIGTKDLFINVAGGGLVGQADAVAHAVAKALASTKDTVRATLKSAGMLTRNSLIKERKKYGQPKARKKFQFSKR